MTTIKNVNQPCQSSLKLIRLLVWGGSVFLVLILSAVVKSCQFTGRQTSAPIPIMMAKPNEARYVSIP